tara:strand:+ start:169 stop:1128 length:960 start_codon:yes stop_codon:yes gene_type:complete
MEPGTISEDGLWKWDGNNWVEHNREIENPLQDSTTPEINDIIKPRTKNILLFILPVVISLLLFSLNSNGWYIAEVWEQDFRTDETEFAGELRLGLKEMQFVDLDNSNVILYDDECKITNSTTEEAYCESLMFTQLATSLLLIFAISALSVMYVSIVLRYFGKFEPVDPQKQANFEKNTLLFIGHLIMIGSIIWSTVFPFTMIVGLQEILISGLSIAYWATIFAAILCYFSFTILTISGIKELNYSDREMKNVLQSAGHNIILFGWGIIIFVNVALNAVVNTGSLLIHSSLVSLAIFHLVGLTIIGKSFEISKLESNPDL